MRGGSHRVCGGFENNELTYDSSKIEINHFQECAKARIGFVEVLKIMT